MKERERKKKKGKKREMNEKMGKINDRKNSFQ